MNNKKNILVKAYTHLNIGDDLFLKILFVRYPNVHFTLIVNDNVYKKVFKNENVSYLEFPKTYLNQKIIRKILSKFFKTQYLEMQYKTNKKTLLAKQHLFDGTLTIGGSIFMEQVEARNNQFSMHRLFSEVFPKKPRFILGSNFGPYQNIAFLEYYNNLLQTYTDVCFRDAYSKSLFPKLQNIRYAKDVVFAGNFPVVNKKAKTVGFSVMDFSTRLNLMKISDDYKNTITKLTKKYLEKGYEIYFFSFCKYEGDEKAIHEITQIFNEEQKKAIKYVFYDGDIDAFLSSFAAMEIMFPTRFHAMILSMIFEQNSHPLLYSKKMSNVLDDLGYKGKYTDLNQQNLAEIEEFELFQFEMTEEIKNDAAQQFEKFTQYIHS